MQCSILALAVVALCAGSMARTLPNGMLYYQSAPVYYKRSAPLTHRMMYVQYLPQHASRRSANAGGVSAFASGDTIATGTYLREGEYGIPEKSVDYQPQDQNIQIADGGAASVAEAYPEQYPLNTAYSETADPDFEIDPLKVLPEQDLPAQDLPAETFPQAPETPELLDATTEITPDQKKEKTPKGLAPEAEDNIEPEPTSVDDLIDQDTPTINNVVSPSVLPPAPRKKIRIELETPESTEYEDEHPYYVPHYHKKNKAVATTHKPAALPPGTFFPINFGGTAGGAIAIANSFSTGEGGSATSTATAYGSPAVARSKAKKRLIKE